MGRHGNSLQHNGPFLSARPLLVALFFFLPIAVPGLIGWLNGLLAVPIFLLLQTAADERTGGLQIRNGLLMAGLASLLTGHLPMFLFTLTMLPLGYSLHLSVARQKTPAESGAAGILTLGISWLLFWSVYGTVSGMNPYIALLTDMDAFLGQVVAVYRTNGDLPADVLYNLERIIEGIRVLLPKILPGLLAGTVLITVSLNMVICSTLMRRVAPDKTVWPPYGDWRLPDKAVWLLICAFALLLVGQGGVKNVGSSLMLISGLLYFFQGAAVVIHVLNRWNLPRTFRFFVYVILALQRYGMLLVVIVGIADTWADFRKLDHKENKDKTE
ncbi:putative membrane protein (DUF2232) [Candidatus Electrothrix marina]|uniref:Putative membrane protein (DUF2232) n=2 Tax=Candidatus Electrothrix marina TaxID=1859130 RepID=A0A444JAJ3_9BACT|nr:putative membrane protein (DUF2232) [Candidatus Electrothrix marina]